MSKNKVITYQELPNSSIIVNNFEHIDYADTYKIILPKSDSVDYFTTKIFSLPQWIKSMLNIRDKIVSIFGIKTGKESSIKLHYNVGEKAGMFTVIERNNTEIVMEENDKHLNFKTSVMVENYANNTSVYLTTIVHYNNIFGRFYFFFVKPFHKKMIKSLLRNLE